MWREACNRRRRDNADVSVETRTELNPGGDGTMVMMLSHLMDRFTTTTHDQRGIVTVEWIILAIIIMVAIIAAFAPQFQAGLSTGLQSISSAMAAQASAAGS